MKPGHWLILGSAILGCTAALGIYLAAMDSPPVKREPQAAAPRLQPAPVVKQRFAITTGPGSRVERASGKTASATKRSSGDSAKPAPDFRIHGKPPAGRVTDEREWFASAEKIGRQANHELEKLRETLELSPNQQQRIFDILARNSPSWQPGMLTGGSYGVGVVSDGAATTSPSNQTRPEPVDQIVDGSSGVEVAAALAVNEEVMTVLDADQQLALIEEENSRLEWWEEILPQLLPPDFPAVGGGDLGISMPGVGDTKAYEGPAEILED